MILLSCYCFTFSWSLHMVSSLIVISLCKLSIILFLLDNSWSMPGLLIDSYYRFLIFIISLYNSKFIVLIFLTYFIRFLFSLIFTSFFLFFYGSVRYDSRRFFCMNPLWGCSFGMCFLGDEQLILFFILNSFTFPSPLIGLAGLFWGINELLIF